MAKSPDAFVYNATLERIVDGDTFDCCLDLGFDVKLHKQRVRLAGIDTPESRTRDKVEKKYGLKAKKFLQDTLKKGKIVIKTHKGTETGKFGRILGEIFVNGVNVNQLMCSKYHAVEYYGQSKESIEEAHLKNRKKVK